jgi:ADP-dependent NAD(P)H-hydrate dehydratase / NAD(P)H-hydrate epimerase
MTIIKPNYESLLPKRNPYSHKGNCGKVGVIAGSINMIGAAILTARAALRSGAGIVYLMTVKEAFPAINIQYPEIIGVPLESKNGHICSTAKHDILTCIQTKEINGLAIGPGLGQSDYVQRLIRSLLFRHLQELTIPCVIDADALNAIDSKRFIRKTNPQFVLTPHPKEFERVFGLKPSQDNKSRIDAAVYAALKTNQTIVLKGKNTVITNGKDVVVNPTGNPGMATAGSGDVLTGIITALIAQGLTPFDAATLGAYLHGKAGDLAYAKKANGLIASDIIDYL